MTDNFGFIHDKLEIKVLILYVLRRLPESVNLSILADLTLIDEGINYFDFAECAADLVRTEHITEKDGKYSVTDKGIRNCDAMEGDIPVSVRRKADVKTAEMTQILKRNAMIVSSCAPRGDGLFTVRFALSDGIDNILKLELLAGDISQAGALEKGFRTKAERIYNKIIAIILED